MQVVIWFAEDSGKKFMFLIEAGNDITQVWMYIEGRYFYSNYCS